MEPSSAAPAASASAEPAPSTPALASGIETRKLFGDVLWVHYGQAYVEPRLDPPMSGDLDGAFRGQVNGMLGAARPGELFLLTSLHTGEVGMTVSLASGPPADDHDWEDVVEVSLRVPPGGVDLFEWAGEATHPLDIPPGDYRVRYRARGMDAAAAVDTLEEDQAPVDHYELVLWTAPLGRDAVVKQTSSTARQFHESLARGD